MSQFFQACSFLCQDSVEVGVSALLGIEKCKGTGMGGFDAIARGHTNHAKEGVVAVPHDGFACSLNEAHGGEDVEGVVDTATNVFVDFRLVEREILGAETRKGIVDELIGELGIGGGTIGTQLGRNGGGEILQAMRVFRGGRAGLFLLGGCGIWARALRRGGGF